MRRHALLAAVAVILVGCSGVGRASPGATPGPLAGEATPTPPPSSGLLSWDAYAEHFRAAYDEGQAFVGKLAIASETGRWSAIDEYSAPFREWARRESAWLTDHKTEACAADAVTAWRGVLFTVGRLVDALDGRDENGAVTQLAELRRSLAAVSAEVRLEPCGQ